MAQDKLAELRDLLGKLVSLVVAAGATLLLALLLVRFSQGANTGGAAAPTAAQPTAIRQAAPAAATTAAPAHEPAPAAPAADPALVAQGKQLFQSQGCIGCHAIKGLSYGAVGPDLTDIGTHAADHLKDPNYKGQAKDPAGFVRESIVDPNVFIAPNCPGGPCQPNVMPQTFGKTLSQEQLDALVAFLMSQR